MISRPVFVFSALSLALIAVVLPRILNTQSDSAQPAVDKVYETGRNNTVLLLSNADHGFGNVVLATASALLAEQPQLEVHFGTFKKFIEPLQRINEMKKKSAGSVKTYIFTGPDSVEAAELLSGSRESSMQYPGLRGFEKFVHLVKTGTQPLDVETHLQTYRQVIDLIGKVNPSVIAIEPMFAAAIDAAVATNTRYVLLVPNTLKDAYAVKQPWAAVLWKYPM